MDNDANIRILNLVHEVTADSVELEELIVKTLPSAQALDPDYSQGLFYFNVKLLKTLKTQRQLLAKLLEYGLEVDEILTSTLETIDKVVKDKEPKNNAMD